MYQLARKAIFLFKLGRGRDKANRAANLLDCDVTPTTREHTKKRQHRRLSVHNCLPIKITGLMANELQCLQIMINKLVHGQFNSPISRAVWFILGEATVIFQLTSVSSSFRSVKFPVLSIWSRSWTEESSEKTMGSSSLSVALIKAMDEPKVVTERWKRFCCWLLFSSFCFCFLFLGWFRLLEYSGI